MSRTWLAQLRITPIRSVRIPPSHTTECHPRPQVNIIQPRHQRRADQQVVVPPTRRHAPPQQPSRPRQDLVRARRQLMRIHPRDLFPAVGELLDPSSIDLTGAASSREEHERRVGNQHGAVNGRGSGRPGHGEMGEDRAGHGSGKRVEGVAGRREMGEESRSGEQRVRMEAGMREVG